MSKLDDLRDRLTKRGISPEEHDDLLRIYADAWATWEEAVARIEGTKLLTKSPRDGVVVSPWVTIKDGATATMDRIGRQLGLSPDHKVIPSLPLWSDFAAAVRE